MQNFVRTELLNILNDKCIRAKKEFDENDMHHFFGNYQASPQNFQILLGERKLVLAAAREINQMNESQSFADYLKFFAVPEKYAISNKNTDKFSVGLYFGKKNRIGMAEIPISNEVMATQVFAKVDPVFSKFIDSGLEAVRKITKDIVKIVDFSSGIRADIICVFCAMNDTDIEALQKTIAVQYERKRGSSSCSWNLANLKKHLQRHLAENSSKQSSQPKLDDSSKQPTQTNLNDSSNASVKLEKNHNEIADESQSHLDEMVNSIIITLPENEKGVFFEQMSTQSLRMTQAALENRELKKVMVVMNEDRFHTIDVLEIAPDGNCLLGACVHQIHAKKLKSKEHHDLVAALRKEIVAHISNHFERYARVLKFRIEEEYECKYGKRPNNVDETQCKAYVGEYLSQPGNWVGAESLMAISELYQTNIIGFNEKETYYFATGYNASYSRFIFIAYRKNSNGDYYHYDSVCGINPELMYKCVNDLSKVVFNHADDVQSL